MISREINFYCIINFRMLEKLIVLWHTIFGGVSARPVPTENRERSEMRHLISL